MNKRWLILLPALASISAAPAPIEPNDPASDLSTRPSAIASSRLPIVRPFAVLPAAPLPRDYSIFNYRSLFMRGHITFASGKSELRPRDRSSSERAADEFAASEAVFVFNGVTQTDEGAQAFIENLATGKVVLARVGQSIAAGKITGISIHTLQYTSGGKSIRIEIGQNLAGVVPPPPIGPSPTSTTKPALAPSDTAGASAPAAGGTNDVLERMRKRREQELGGK